MRRKLMVPLVAKSAPGGELVPRVAQAFKSHRPASAAVHDVENQAGFTPVGAVHPLSSPAAPPAATEFEEPGHAPFASVVGEDAAVSLTLSLAAPRASASTSAGLKPRGTTFRTPQSLHLVSALGSSGSSSSVQLPVVKVEPPAHFAVMYTKQSTKKHKVYEDGILLVVEGKKYTLFDTEGKSVAKQTGSYGTLKPDNRIDIGRFELEIVSAIEAQEYNSGRVFIGKAPVGAPAPAPGASGTGATTSTASSSKSRGGPTPLAATASDVSRGSTRVAVKPVMPSQPRHTPFMADALVLQWPGGVPLTSPPPAWSGGLPVVVDPVLTHHLRPHQREGIRFMWDCVMGLSASGGHGCILADEMGLGKTLQTVALIWTLLKQSVGGVGAIQKAVVVCPSSLVNNWRAEFKKWLGDERCKPLAMDKQGAEAADMIRDFIAGSHTVHPVLIISYEMVRKHHELLSGSEANKSIGLLVCDEAHRLKSVGGNKTIDALSALPTPRRVLLSGTPVQNNLEELYAMVSFANPGILGTIAVFRRVFQAPIESGSDKVASTAMKTLCEERSGELSRQLSTFVLRRTSKVLEAVLPPKTELSVFCRLSPRQADVYRSLLRTRFAFNAGEAVLVLLNLLRKVCVHPDFVPPGTVNATNTSTGGSSGVVHSGMKRPSLPLPRPRAIAPNHHTATRADPPLEAADALVAEEEDGGVEESAVSLEDLVALDEQAGVDAAGGAAALPESLDRLVASCSSSIKLTVVKHLLKTVRNATDDKVVLISNFTQVLDVLEKLCQTEGYPVLRLDGGTPSDKRQVLVNRFNARDDPTFVFLLSSQAGGVGLNLIGANRLVLFDPSWNPAIDRQALARVWRDGQRKPTFIYRLFAAHTIEEKILQRQLLKNEYALAADGKSGGEKGASSRFSKHELKALFAMDPGSTDVCDTFQVMRAARATGASSGGGGGSSGSKGGDDVDAPDAFAWPAYTGPDCVEDVLLRSTIEGMADPADISYVHAVHFGGAARALPVAVAPQNAAGGAGVGKAAAGERHPADRANASAEGMDLGSCEALDLSE